MDKRREKKSKPKHQQLTFSQEDFHASRSLLPGAEKAREMTVSSGEKCYELSKSQSRLSSLVKMLLESSIWNSTIVYLNWKVKATKRRRLLYQLVPSHPPTDEIESGLWHTPNTMDATAGAIPAKQVVISKTGVVRKIDNSGKSRGLGLAREVQMWPTPTVSDQYNAHLKPNKDGIPHDIAKGNLRGVAKMFPTPTQRDYKGGYKKESLISKGGINRGTGLLPNAVLDGKGTETATGQLNPTFCEWLMGYPIGWTDLKDSETQ